MKSRRFLIFVLAILLKFLRIRWIFRAIRFHRFHQSHRFQKRPFCLIHVTKMQDFIGLKSHRFHRSMNSGGPGFWQVISQKTAWILSRTLKFAQFSNQNWFRHHANPNTKDLIATCSLPVRKAPWKIIAARVNHFQKPNDDTTRCMLHSIPTRPS